MIWEDENPKTGKRTNIVSIIGWTLIAVSVLIILFSFAFGQDFIFEETHIGIGDPPNSLPPLHIFDGAPIEIYDIIIVDGKEMRIIKDTNNSAWKKYPSLKTKVIMTVQHDDDWGISSRMEIIPHGKIDTVGIWYLNYKEYWNDMLLCEPNPDAILEINCPNSSLGYPKGWQPNQKLNIIGEGQELFGEPKKQKE